MIENANDGLVGYQCEGGQQVSHDAPSSHLDTDIIVRALCAFADNGANNLQVRRRRVTSSSLSRRGTFSHSLTISTSSRASGKRDPQHGEREQEEVRSDISKEATGPDDSYEFHPLLLTFESPAIERHFASFIAKMGINGFCCRMFLLITSLLFVVQLCVQCRESQDMGVASAMLALIGFMTAYVFFIKEDNPFHILITFAFNNTLMAMAFVATTARCGGSDTGRYVGDVAALYACVSCFAPQYCLGVKLVYRSALTFSTLILGAVSMAVRHYTLDDGVTKLDTLPVCGLAFAILSFFPEYSLRSAFRRELRLKGMQRAAKSKSAVMAMSALSIMLPSFVTEKVIALAQEKKLTSAIYQHTKSTASEAKTHNTKNSDGGGDTLDIDFNSVAATWEYNHATVMFAKFSSPSSDSLSPHVINAIVTDVETIAKRLDVMKVKTIGTTIMLVCGIDDPRSREDQVTGVLDAAVMVRNCVFLSQSTGTLQFRIGIHCDPCFGAVIGGNGAIFDLFGDTVNTASRVMSTAPAGVIQFSPAVEGLLLSRLREVVEPPRAVTAKGKGSIDVFTLGQVSLERLPARRSLLMACIRSPSREPQWMGIVW